MSAATLPPPKLPPSRPPPSPLGKPALPAKTFRVQQWTGSGQGKKILIYGPNGMGKTTLASMAPNPVFIGLDDGGREIRNPKTGAPLNAIPGVETFQDLRDALHQYSLFPPGSSFVLDTITLAEQLAAKHLFATIKASVNGREVTAENIEDYGWGKGYVYLIDPIRNLLSNMDALVRRGVNIVLLAQQCTATVANMAGVDYMQDGPTLESKPKNANNVRSEVIGWCDNVFRIGYPDVSVERANKQASKGKAHGTTERMIFTEPEVYFVAKNRMNGTLPPVVTFAERTNDDLWQMVFAGAS